MIKNLAQWSMAIRKRDGQCTECGTSRSLVAHHIKEKSTHPELALDLSNGVTLCSNCHNERHRSQPAPAHSADSFDRKARRKAKIAILRAENAALKQEIAELRKLPRVLEVEPEEVTALRQQLAEYENAYHRLTSWSAG